MVDTGTPSDTETHAEGPVAATDWELMAEDEVLALGLISHRSRIKR